MGDILLQEADVIKTAINGLRNNVKTLQTQHKQALFALTPEQTNKISQDIQKLTDDINTQINNIKIKIDALRRSADATGDHMRHNMSESLSGKFAEVLQQYQRAQQDYGEKIKAKMVQKVKIVHPQATNEEIEEAIERGDVDKMMVQSTLDGAYMQGQAKNAMSYVQDRHRDIKAIEASVRDLNQLFLDMNVLVHQQGVMLDNIQESVNSAVLDTGVGAENLGKAVKAQKQGRKKMYIILCILIIILILVLSIGLGVGLPKISKK